MNIVIESDVCLKVVMDVVDSCEMSSADVASLFSRVVAAVVETVGDVVFDLVSNRVAVLP